MRKFLCWNEPTSPSPREWRNYGPEGISTPYGPPTSTSHSPCFPLQGDPPKQSTPELDKVPRRCFPSREATGPETAACCLYPGPPRELPNREPQNPALAAPKVQLPPHAMGQASGAARSETRPTGWAWASRRRLTPGLLGLQEPQGTANPGGGVSPAAARPQADPLLPAGSGRPRLGLPCSRQPAARLPAGPGAGRPRSPRPSSPPERSAPAPAPPLPPPPPLGSRSGLPLRLGTRSRKGKAAPLPAEGKTGHSTREKPRRA